MKKGREARPHIGIFGCRNNGKSSLVNVITGQDIAIVSEIAGTTTDPVRKSIEIFGIGPVVLVDTAGIDDFGELGEKRKKKSIGVLDQIDLAILVLAGNQFDSNEEKMAGLFRDREIPYVVVHNKSDLEPAKQGFVEEVSRVTQAPFIDFSTVEPVNLDQLISTLKETIPPNAYLHRSLIGDIINEGDLVVLVTPIDAEAPEGRLILPQVQMIRDVLDNDCVALVTKENGLKDLMQVLNPRPALVITDSQAFKVVGEAVPPEIPLTSFSTVLARYKGDFQHYLEGTPRLSKLEDGDKVLVLESCTHHIACDDIGRDKIPKWLRDFTGKDLSFHVVAGHDSPPGDIRDYAIVIQCGGCMFTKKQISNKLKPAIDAGVPVTNYGMAIAWVMGIYQRAIAPFVTNPLEYIK